jgi:hypothetical protein
MDDSQGAEELMGESQGDDLGMRRESYADLRQRWGLDSEEDGYARGLDSIDREISKDTPAALPFGLANDLKSISELRSKGETRRFLDEMGYLFEGLNASAAMGVRRGRYVRCTVQFFMN